MIYCKKHLQKNHINKREKKVYNSNFNINIELSSNNI